MSEIILSNRVLNMAESATLAMTNKSRELKAQGIDVISLSIGEPDFNTPESAKQAGVDAINNNDTHYPPVPGTPALRKAIANKLKRDNGLDYKETDILVSNGAKQAINNALLAIVNDGDEVIIPAPFWVSYPEMVKLAGGVPVIVKSDIANHRRATRKGHHTQDQGVHDQHALQPQRQRVHQGRTDRHRRSLEEISPNHHHLRRDL